MMKKILSIFAVELKLGFRSADMLLFGLAFPVAIMLLLGAVSGPGGAPLAFGGVAAIGICATGLMGLPLTLADYRHRRVLKRFQASPASPGALLAAQALTQLCVALASSGLVWAVARYAYGVRVVGGFGRFAAAYAATLAAIYALGLLVAALARSMKAANAAASLLYFPMFFLSGTTVPAEIMPPALRAATGVLPLSHGVELMKAAVIGVPAVGEAWRYALLLGIAAVGYTVAALRFRWD